MKQDTIAARERIQDIWRRETGRRSDQMLTAGEEEWRFMEALLKDGKFAK